MTKSIDPGRLKELRRQKKLSQQELARLANLTKGSLHRLEAGRQPGNRRRTLEGLAGALEVAPGVLTGDMPLPEEELAGGPKRDAAGSQMNLRVNMAVRNAFWLASRCYGIPMTRIVELAPFLFVCAAEASLARRRAKLAELEAVFDRLDDLRRALPHLAGALSGVSRIREAFEAEKASIAKRDILAADFPDDLLPGAGPEGDDDTGRAAYEPPERNPFIVHLKEIEPDEPRVAEIDWLDTTSVVSAVCYADAMALAGGDEELAGHIVDGFVALHKMPRELASGEASERRVAWLKEKSPAEDLSDEELARYYPADDEEQAP